MFRKSIFQSKEICFVKLINLITYDNNLKKHTKNPPLAKLHLIRIQG